MTDEREEENHIDKNNGITEKVIENNQHDFNRTEKEIYNNSEENSNINVYATV